MSLLASVIGTFVLVALFATVVAKRAREVDAGWRAALLAFIGCVAFVSAAAVGSMSLLGSVIGSGALVVLFGLLVVRRAREVHAGWRTGLLAFVVGVVLTSAAFVGAWILMRAVN
jgi:hypothetical protein